MPRVRNPNLPVFDFQLNPNKPNLSKTTLKNYKNQLNKLVLLSHEANQKDSAFPVLTTKEVLLSNAERVATLIDTVDNRMTRCAMYSAVFYAIGRQDLDKDATALPLVQGFRRTYYTPEYLQKRKEQGEIIE